MTCVSSHRCIGSSVVGKKKFRLKGFISLEEINLSRQKQNYRFYSFDKSRYFPIKREIYRGYSNFWNEYAIYFIEWSEKCIFHEWRSHEWNIHFLASRDEINGIFIPKIWIFFLLYTILSVTDFFAVNDVIHVRTLRHFNADVASCTMTAETESIRAGVERVKISTNLDNFITKIFLAI